MVMGTRHMVALRFPLDDVDSGASLIEFTVCFQVLGMGRRNIVFGGRSSRHVLLVHAPLPYSPTPCFTRSPLPSVPGHGTPHPRAKMGNVLRGTNTNGGLLWCGYRQYPLGRPVP